MIKIIKNYDKDKFEIEVNSYILKGWKIQNPITMEKRRCAGEDIDGQYDFQVTDYTVILNKPK